MPRDEAIPNFRGDLAAWPRRRRGKYPKPTDWVEVHIGETLAFYRLRAQGTQPPPAYSALAASATSGWRRSATGVVSQPSARFRQ